MSQFLKDHWDALLGRTAEHLAMAGSASLAALVIGVIIAVAVYRHAALRVPLLTIAGTVQTIPGIALLVIMMALLGRIGSWPAVSTLFLFALFPIIQNAIVALNGLPPALEETSRGLGMTQLQALRYVRLPLALPGIIAGLRIAVVQTIGLATLAAFVGAGGLGQFINRGLFLSDTKLILLGAIPAALIALVADQLINLLQFSNSSGPSCFARRSAFAVWLAGVGLLVGFTLTHLEIAPAGKDTIVVGSKNFTEQLIIAEIVAEQIERETPFKVERRFGLGGSTILHEALSQHSVDVAVEYSGTGLTAILHQPVPSDRSQILPLLRREYQQRFGLTWLDPLGFNNSYGLGVRDHDPHMAHITSISDLAASSLQLSAAFDFEFAERPDGYAGLQKAYGLHFREVRDMHPDLMYDTLKNHQTDVISAYTTDGRLQRDGIRILRDDKGFLPPYIASIVVSPAMLKQKPGLAKALEQLSGKLSDDTMRRLNAAVDDKRMTIEQAARAFLSDSAKKTGPYGT
jgi:osmoprotectant transport system permease protein